VLAGRGDRVVRGKLVEELDIGDESRPCEDAFKQVVTQQGILRHPPGKGRFERIYLVDPFPDIRTLAEKVLVDVGDGGGVRVDATRAREDALEKRAFTIGRERRCNTRLKHGVPLNDSADTRVKPRPIDGMCQGADQSAGGPPRQPRVGIKRDDVPDARRKERCATTRWQKGGVCGTAQQTIQFLQLPPFAFPPDPLPLALVPAAPTVEQEEALATVRGGPVASVQPRDALNRCSKESVVFRHGF
jgi:hypothetical protein